MTSNFRKITFDKIAERAYISKGDEFNITTPVAYVKSEMDIDPILKAARSLTDLVKRHLSGDLSFKDKFLKLKASPERESLVFDEIIKRKPIKLVPITVPGPFGTKVTYKVMPDYITIDGIRVPMSGQTAQKVANYFGMHLPTSKMSKQIWDAADVKVRPPPLSTGGRIGGKYYSGEDVVRGKISDSDSAVAYSQMIADEIKGRKGLKAGHMKDVIAPEGDPNKLGLYGWYGPKDGKPIETSIQTGHDTSIHTEYGAGTRLIADQITVTLPSGKVINTTMDKLRNHPEMHKAISNAAGISKYNI